MADSSRASDPQIESMFFKRLSQVAGVAPFPGARSVLVALGWMLMTLLRCAAGGSSKVSDFFAFLSAVMEECG